MPEKPVTTSSSAQWPAFSVLTEDSSMISSLGTRIK